MGKVMINAGGGGGGASSDETNVVASQVLSGKTYLGADTNDEVGTGTMPNNGTVSQTLNAGGSYTIPAGYHNGSGKVTANSLSSQTSGTAAASEILSGKTAWVNGVKITGTMTNRGAVTSSLNAGGSYTIPAGYHNGSGKVTANSLSSQTSGTANASRILSGYTAWVNGSKITGSMTNQGAKTASLNAGGSYTIPAGYHNGSGKVTANSLSSQTSATAVAADILSGKTAYVKGSKITGTMGTMAGGTYTPSTSKQTISCSGKKMTSNITINAIPSTYIDMGSNGSWTVFNQGTFSGGFGFVPYYLNTSTMQQSNYSVIYENKTESNATNFDSDFNGETKYCVNVIRAIPQALVLNRAVNLTSLSRIRVEWYMYLPRNSSSDFNLLLINKNKQSISKTFYEDRTSAWSSRSFYVYSFISYDISDYSGEYFIGFQSNRSSVGISQIIFVK